jgi:hypothetical protein
MDRVLAPEEGCLGGRNIVEFAMDVELVFGLSFSSLALSFDQGLLDSFTGTCCGALAFNLDQHYLPRWVLGNSLQGISGAIKSSICCCPATTELYGAGSILSVLCILDMLSLITDIGRGADVAWLLVRYCPLTCCGSMGVRAGVC